MKQPTIEDIYDMQKLLLRRLTRLEEKLTKKEKVPYVMSEADKLKLRFKMNKRKAS